VLLCVEKPSSTFLIPQSTFIFKIYYYSGAVHHTESLFPNHSIFRPERFLEKGKFVPDEHVLYFGSGKRRKEIHQMRLM
jgi:hypothetical protein